MVGSILSMGALFELLWQSSCEGLMHKVMTCESCVFDAGIGGKRISAKAYLLELQ